MSQWIETIRLDNGRFFNLAYHERRMSRTLAYETGKSGDIDLLPFLHSLSPPLQGLYKCRMVYDVVRRDVEFIPYFPRQVNSLKLVFDDDIRYEQKFSDRRKLEEHLEKRGTCDDILIVQNGLVTDTSSANIVFRRGDKWITPASYLLPGTQRQLLLDDGRIREEEVGVAGVTAFTAFKLINAMVMFDAGEVSTCNIFE